MVSCKVFEFVGGGVAIGPCFFNQYKLELGEGLVAAKVSCSVLDEGSLSFCLFLFLSLYKYCILSLRMMGGNVISPCPSTSLLSL